MVQRATLRKSSVNVVRRAGKLISDSCQFVLTPGDFAVFNVWLTRLSGELQQPATKNIPEYSKPEACKRIIRKQLARAEAVRAQAAREEAARAQAARERAVTEKATRAQAAKERAVIEKAARAQAVRAQAARARAAREQAVRAQAAREQAAREQAVRVQAANTQKEVSNDTLQKTEVRALLARYAIGDAENCIERAWEQMARWKAAEDQIPEEKIRTAAEEIQAATKKIQTAVDEIQIAEEQQQVLCKRVLAAEKELNIINPTHPPCHPRYDNEKVDAVVEKLLTMTDTVFFRYPALPVAAILVLVYAGKTLAGALIGGLLLGMSLAPPVLALAIVGLVYLKQRIDKPPMVVRHSFFQADPGDNGIGVASGSAENTSGDEEVLVNMEHGDKSSATIHLT